MAESNRTGTQLPQSCVALAAEANAQIEGCARVAVALLHKGDSEDRDAVIALVLRMKELGQATMSALAEEELDDVKQVVTGGREVTHG